MRKMWDEITKNIFIYLGEGHASEEECKSKNGAGVKTENGNVDLSHVSWSIHRKKQLQKTKDECMHCMHAYTFVLNYTDLVYASDNN